MEKNNPFYSDKGLEANKIIIKGKNKLITNSSTLANLCNNYFISITNTSKLKQSLPKLLINYSDHMSIKKIKETYKIAEKFHLKEVLFEEVKKFIKSLNNKKSSISSCIPVEVLIGSVDICLPIFTDIVNSSIRKDTFPEELKLVEVTPLFKKNDPFDKVNYRPVSLPWQVSKVYKIIIFNQISTCFEPYLSTFLTGFWKNHNTQHSLLKMLELWKEALDKGKPFGAIFMDLSKAFDTLNHDLLIAKLGA